MAYVNIDGTDYVGSSREILLERDEELRKCFRGTAFPTSPAAVVGQICYRTDLGQHYRCIDDDPVTWEVLGLGYFLRLAGGDLTGALNTLEAAAIASASSIDLDAMVGNYGHVTGTTTITEMVLTKGERLLIFDGAVDITLSASLLGPPTQNTGTLAMGANDSCWVVSEGSDVTRIVAVFRGNGRAVDDARYQLASGAREFTAAPVVTGAGRLLRAASGVDAASGKVSWGSASPGTLAEGEIYLKHA